MNTKPPPTEAQKFIATRLKTIVNVAMFYHSKKGTKDKERELIGKAGTRVMSDVWSNGFSRGVMTNWEAIDALRSLFKWCADFVDENESKKVIGQITRHVRTIQATKVMDHIGEGE